MQKHSHLGPALSVIKSCQENTGDGKDSGPQRQTCQLAQPYHCVSEGKDSLGGGNPRQPKSLRGYQPLSLPGPLRLSRYPRKGRRASGRTTPSPKILRLEGRKDGPMGQAVGGARETVISTLRDKGRPQLCVREKERKPEFPHRSSGGQFGTPQRGRVPGFAQLVSSITPRVPAPARPPQVTYLTDLRPLPTARGWTKGVEGKSSSHVTTTRHRRSTPASNDVFSH